MKLFYLREIPLLREFLKVMIITKLILVFLITIFLKQGQSATVQYISVSKTNVPLRVVLKEIRVQSGYDFFFEEASLESSKPVSVNIKNGTIEEVLDITFRDQPLTYSIAEKTIIVKNKPARKVLPVRETNLNKPANQNDIGGKITNESGEPLVGVSVSIKGTSQGTSTSVDGTFTISAKSGDILIFSYIGFNRQEVTISNQTFLNIKLVEDNETMDEVVITALGISREKKSLGYASQEVSGEDVNTVKSDNITNALSGKVAGLQIKRNTNMGGSTNAVIRGNNSLTGDNQALWVVDGVPIDNSSFNTDDQKQGSSGFDFGNAASDINSDDIESINVLKGAAATALYGSRAANGAIIITTKKGAKGKKFEVLVNSGINIGSVDKATFPTFQTVYGGGYGKFNGVNKDGYFDEIDVDGDGTLDLVSPYAQYASYGAPFDPNLFVYQWNSYDPASPDYLSKTPWVAAQNGPLTFFETPVTLNNNISVGGTLDAGSYRFSYTNFDQKGILPNSHLKRNNVSMNATFQITDKLSISGSSNYVKTDALGRNQTGTDFRGNAASVFRHYWNTNVDVRELRDIYMQTKRNVTHTPERSMDNLYFNRYENYGTDSRNRFFGNISLKYDIADWLNIEGRSAIDTYSFIEEDRRSNQSGGVSRYSRRDITYNEVNYDIMLNFNRNLNDDLNLSGVVGTNIRRNNFQSIYSVTNGGIIIDRLYSLSNSVNTPQAPREVFERSGVDGIYGLASMGYKGILYLDLTGRRDHSSTLPKGNSSYFYPSIATSFVFSELMTGDFISFGKLRLNYAEVGSSAPVGILKDVLIKPSLFGSVLNYETNPTKRNEELKPERTESIEAGIEMYFLNRRLGADLSLYRTNTRDQIMPVSVTPASGYITKFVNSGEIENKGIEVSLSGTPIKKENFNWSVQINWARNRNKVVSLFESVTNLQIAAVSEGVTVNATVGEPYGVIRGTDFIYLDGKKVINQENGAYLKTDDSNHNLGYAFPEWGGGISNHIRYKDFNFSFLIDGQKGGSIFSIDNLYGYESGAYDIFIGNNDLGNPIRNSLEEGGGILLEGVTPNGEINQVRTTMNDNANAYGSRKAPSALHVYDASFIKLREVALSYRLPANLFKTKKISGIQLSLIGSNLWIIKKNIPFSDPESGFGSGNIQGIQAGMLPVIRELGFNVKVQF